MDLSETSSAIGLSGNVLLAISTFPDIEVARRIARELVETRIVACANIGNPAESIYRWQEKVEANNETLVLFKFAAERYPDFEKRLRELHPYEIPEIIALPLTQASQPYLDWVRANSLAVTTDCS